MTAAGYQVVWLLEGSTAIDQIVALHPFAVITNAQSDQDGISLIQDLRQNLTTQAVKVIVMVDESNVDESNRKARVDWMAIGADDWLFQPVRPELLLQKILLMI